MDATLNRLSHIVIGCAIEVTEFTSGLSGTQSLALPFEKHGQLAANLVIVRQKDRTGRTDELCGRARHALQRHITTLFHHPLTFVSSAPLW